MMVLLRIGAAVFLSASTYYYTQSFFDLDSGSSTVILARMISGVVGVATFIYFLMPLAEHEK